MANNSPKRKNRAPLNLLMGALGLVATAILMLQSFTAIPDPLRLISGITVLIAVPTMFFTRKSDEYTLQLWSTAANAAFAVTIFFFFGLALVQGFLNAHDGDSASRTLDTADIMDFTILSFFLAFNIKRLTGAM